MISSIWNNTVCSSSTWLKEKASDCKKTGGAPLPPARPPDPASAHTNHCWHFPQFFGSDSILRLKIAHSSNHPCFILFITSFSLNDQVSFQCNTNLYTYSSKRTKHYWLTKVLNLWICSILIRPWYFSAFPHWFSKDWQLSLLSSFSLPLSLLLHLLLTRHLHCVKTVQIRSFLWSVFSSIRTEYGEILRISPYSVWMRENMDQKKLRISTLFTQCYKTDKICAIPIEIQLQLYPKPFL